MTRQRNETPEPLAQGQAVEMPEIAAIRAALAAGPTPGIWIGAGPSFGDQFPRYISEILQDRDDDEECEVTICEFPAASLEPENEANALLISACNPVAIAAVLAHYDAALQAKDAEIARLKADAGRYRWLRDNSHPLSGRIDIAEGDPPCHLYGEKLDAAIDAMKGEAS